MTFADVAERTARGVVCHPGGLVARYPDVKLGDVLSLLGFVSQNGKRGV